MLWLVWTEETVGGNRLSYRIPCETTPTVAEFKRLLSAAADRMVKEAANQRVLGDPTLVRLTVELVDSNSSRKSEEVRVEGLDPMLPLLADAGRPYGGCSRQRRESRGTRLPFGSPAPSSSS